LDNCEFGIMILEIGGDDGDWEGGGVGKVLLIHLEP